MHIWDLVKEYNTHGLLWVKIKVQMKERLINCSAVILLPKAVETYSHSCAFFTENFGVRLSENKSAL